MRRLQRRSPLSNEPLQPLLTIADVCKMFHFSRPTVRKLIAQGLPVIRFGKAVRFSPTSLKQWLAMREEIA